MMNKRTDSVRESYDRVAAAYAEHYANELLHKPFDREVLSRFAAEISDSGAVCDMGCGPGHIARYLRHRGLTNISGLDLSPEMVEQARRANPDIPFQVGNMLALDLPDQSLAGIVAFYAIVNTPPDSLPIVFREMYRVLQNDGRLLVSFHRGEEVVHPDELLGQPISMEFFFFRPSEVTKQMEEAGFVIHDVTERPPYSPAVEYQSWRAYIFARKRWPLDGKRRS
jgi:ubiquinone/menaquinone biosynthesis C-methylase UbiE